MRVISSSFKPPGVCCLGLNLDVGAAVWPQVRQVCRMSCAERAMRREVCPAPLCSSCPLSWPSCATAVLAPLCYRVWYSELLLTSDLLSHHEQVRGLWGQSLAVMSPSLPASLSSSTVGWPWSLEQSALDAAWWNSAVSSDTGELSLTLIASLRYHLSNLHGLFLLA